MVVRSGVTERISGNLGKIPNVPKRVHFAPDMPEKIEASGENRTKSGRKVIKPKRLIEEM